MGDKGFNLSGGQKQRICIARAVYREADIYLFDNPLSALDTQVARHVFDNVFGPQGLLSRKIRLMVTHKLNILPLVDRIVLFDHGSIACQGTYDDLSTQNIKFKNFIQSESHTPVVQLEPQRDETISDDSYLELPSEDLIVQTDDSDLIEQVSDQIERNFSMFCRSNSLLMRKLSLKHKKKSNKNDLKVQDKPNQVENGDQESTNTGSILTAIYWTYLKLIGGWHFLTIFIFFTTSHIFLVLNNVWLSRWSSENANSSLASSPPTRSQWYYLSVYAGYGLGQAIFIVLGTLVLNLSCLQASRHLHSGMISSIMRAPLWFFDVTSSGQILNRFTKDIDIADTNLISNVRLFFIELFRTIASFYIICIGTDSFLIMILFVTLMILYAGIYRFYISSSRQLIRLESVLRTPIYSHINETYSGLHCIQSFNVTHQYRAQCFEYMEANNSAIHMSFAVSRWLNILLAFLGNLVVLSAGLLCVLCPNISPGMAAIGITSALTVTNTLSLLVRSSSDLESNIVSIERLVDYTGLPQESSWHAQETGSKPNQWTLQAHKTLMHHHTKWTDKLLKLWNLVAGNCFACATSSFIKPRSLCPAREKGNHFQSGSIALNNYSARYQRGCNLCLRNINVNIESGLKVGIVGRTGAGKSSFALALFR